MQNPDRPNAAVKAKAILVDPESMTVLWMNESALQDYSDEDGASAVGVTVAQAIPLGETLGLPNALIAAAETGVSQHLRSDLVSTTKGSVVIVTSVYSVLDGRLLVLMENAWQAAQRSRGSREPRGSGRG